MNVKLIVEIKGVKNNTPAHELKPEILRAIEHGEVKWFSMNGNIVGFIEITKQ